MFKKSLYEFILYSLICGLLYPFVIFAAGNIFFYQQANGSLVKQGNTIVGSRLIGQNFNDPKYFWGRPSATAYNGLSSGASNSALTNPSFRSSLEERIRNIDGDDIPVDLVTASGSGLDPDISLASAKFQAKRVANARNLPLQKVLAMIDQLSQKKHFGLIGTPRINVLMLNIELDKV